MSLGPKHIPVLLEDSVSVLAIKPDSIVVDCTLGGGGHGREIIKLLGRGGKYVGIDADRVAIEKASDLKENTDAEIHLVNDNFSNLKNIVSDLEIKPTAILADLGWRTDQFEDGGKGFSFMKDEPLLMTFGDPETRLFTAEEIVNDWEENSIADIIYGYGEERQARRIAKFIVEARKKGRIKTSKQLADIVTEAVPAFYRRLKIHPATKTFQAIRITVNDELGVLKTLLSDGFESLDSGGRLAIISFHSLEDRIVKQFFNQLIQDDKALKLIKKPIVAGEAERDENPRSRSAKLRVIEKL